MAKIISFSQVLSAQDDAGADTATQEEKDLEVLKSVFPHICNDVAMLIARPFRFFWDPLRPTASTDCKAEIYMPPSFFTQAGVEIGFGSVYHECGHILFSPTGMDLLSSAYRAGGETRRHIMNLILDRKDDILTADYAPGFAPVLRQRLSYIATLAYREMAKSRLEKLQGKVSEKEVTKILRNRKPKDVYEDFFFACKWHKRPRYKRTFRAMKYLTRRNLLSASRGKLLWICERIHIILGEMPQIEKEESEAGFQKLCVLVTAIEKGGSAPTAVLGGLAQLVKTHLAKITSSGMHKLVSQLQTMAQGIVHPGPISTGRAHNIQIKKVEPNPRYEKENKGLLDSVRHLVEPLVQKLRRIDNPSQYILFGRDEGELDLTQTARIAAGISGIYKETVTERDIDAEMHLAIDASGSMAGSKIHTAKKIAALFSQAILALDPLVKGRIWAFSSCAIYDFGAVSPSSGFVTMSGEAGNSDCDMLKACGTALARSTKRRKVLIVICDDGPDNIELARKLSHGLLARGIIPVHIMVEVHGTPNIYPIELIYDTMEDCLDEFGKLLEKIISHLK